jgi:chromate transporter
MTPPRVPLRELFLRFLAIGAVSFGGGMIAYQKVLLIDRKQWLTRDEFMAALAISQALPGLNSVNLAILAGDRLRGLPGALAAMLGLVLPGACFLLAAAVLYAQGQDHEIGRLLLGAVAAVATGVLAGVTAVLGGEHFRSVRSVALITATFVLTSVVKLALLQVLLIMVPLAIVIYRPRR